MRLLLGMTLALSLWAQTSVMFSPVRGTREMVGAANNFQVEAGWRLLMAGGNAVDAGVAAVLAAAVTEQGRFGLGGEMPLLVKMSSQDAIAISGVGTAPALATAAVYRRRSPESWEQTINMSPFPSMGLKAAVLPGAFDGLVLALSRSGTKSYCEVSAPAAELARGFPMGEEYAQFIDNLARYIRLWPTSREFFLPGGELPVRGDVFRSTNLARTLESLCAVEKKARGSRQKKLAAVRDEFYRGSLARRIAEFSEQEGGYIRYSDLAGFHAEADAPRGVTYRGYTVVKPGFWTQGPVLLQALNILEGFDLKAMGHNSARYLHTVVEALKLAFADRDRYYGDPKFSRIPEETLLSKEYAAERRKLIDPAHASLEHRPGSFGAPMDLSHPPSGPAQDFDTTCVNVIDRFGNAFSATPSGAWLPSVIAGDTGIPMSTRLQSFVLTPGHANELAPGKRPRVTLSPTLVLKDGKPWLVMSTPGGDNQDQAMLQVLLNLIEFGMHAQDAAEAPRVQSTHFYSSFSDHEFVSGRLSIENRINTDTAGRLRALGHLVAYTGPWTNGSAPTLIKVEGGVLEGGADPRRLRFIFGR